MTIMHRVRLQYTGFVNGPAVSTLFFVPTTPTDSTAQAAVDRVRDFMVAIKPYIYAACTWTVSGQVDDVDSVSGDLQSSHAVVDRSDGGSGSINPVPPANQLMYRFETGQVVNGKRIRGHLYIPGSDTFNAAGQPSGGIVTASPAALSALVGTTTPLVVWSRPVGPHGAVRPGNARSIISSTLRSKYAILRSRRD